MQFFEAAGRRMICSVSSDHILGTMIQILMLSNVVRNMSFKKRSYWSLFFGVFISEIKTSLEMSYSGVDRNTLCIYRFFD